MPASGFGFRSAPGRPPAIAAEAMVATSQPLATRAGLRALERGGNAADAALAAAAVLCVTEPMSTGIGGDCFALVWRDGRLQGLDAAGPAPRAAEPVTPVEAIGPRSVTVPGAVAGWAALAERHGRLGLDACLADAIDAAERGYAVGARTAASWADAARPHDAWPPTRVPPELAPPPARGQRIRLPELATTLRGIAAGGPDAFYGGAVARAICDVSWLEEDDLAAFEARWVEPLLARYRDVEVAELPPPTQGVAALEALALLDGLEPDLPAQVACARLALADARGRVRDGADVSDLLAPSFLERRRAAAANRVTEPAGGTVYLCAVDGDRMAVSLVQSLFGRFGSGLVAPGTGVVLQNRGACFALHGTDETGAAGDGAAGTGAAGNGAAGSGAASNGAVEPGRRPYHTIIPGMLLRGGGLAGPFGVMGGLIQAQAHMQLVSALVDEGLDPQAALDRPRFRIEDGRVRIEEGLWDRAEELERGGHVVVRDADPFAFGGGQAILVDGDALVGGSDARKDGYAAGL
jgi:gamma-glutamyltranspeptidase / glutathione hydrolase